MGPQTLQTLSLRRAPVAPRLRTTRTVLQGTPLSVPLPCRRPPPPPSHEGPSPEPELAVTHELGEPEAVKEELKEELKEEVNEELKEKLKEEPKEELKEPEAVKDELMEPLNKNDQADGEMQLREVKRLKTKEFHSEELCQQPGPKELHDPALSNGEIRRRDVEQLREMQDRMELELPQRLYEELRSYRLRTHRRRLRSMQLWQAGGPKQDSGHHEPKTVGGSERDEDHKQPEQDEGLSECQKHNGAEQEGPKDDENYKGQVDQQPKVTGLHPQERHDKPPEHPQQVPEEEARPSCRQTSKFVPPWPADALPQHTLPHPQQPGFASPYWQLEELRQHALPQPQQQRITPPHSQVGEAPQHTSPRLRHSQDPQRKGQEQPPRKLPVQLWGEPAPEHDLPEQQQPAPKLKRQPSPKHVPPPRHVPPPTPRHDVPPPSTVLEWRTKFVTDPMAQPAGGLCLRGCDCGRCGSEIQCGWAVHLVLTPTPACPPAGSGDEGRGQDT